MQPAGRVGLIGVNNQQIVFHAEFLQIDLVQAINREWMPQAPSLCPNGYPLDPIQVLVGHVACLGHGGAGTPRGIVGPAMP